MAELAILVAGNVLEKLGSVAKDEINLVWGVKKDLNKLKDETLMLKSVLQDAEKKQSRDEQLREWLVRVKDVFNDAVDVLDEVDCEALRRQVVREYGSVGRKVRRFFSSANPIAFRFSIAHKIKEILERLDKISQDMAKHQLIRSQLSGYEEQSLLSDHEQRDRKTHSFINTSEVIGRDSDKAQIIDMLLSHEDDNLRVIPIVGIGGLGKTTLVKSVYNDDKVGARFDLKLWVCVSLDFNVIRLVREILRETKAEDDISNMSPEQLQTSLRNVLQGKNFLLVLDDVWNEDRAKWLELRALLAVGSKSKIIVTTRTTLVSSIMTTIQPHHLKGLSNAESETLFFKCAFEDEKLAERNPRLKDIGKEIVRKCGGVPLALKSLGSMLYSKTDETEWIRIRDNEIWELERGEGRILPALRLSYSTMSPCLKQCFSYCSTYSEDAKLNNSELINIWMALGILQSPNEETEVEDVGQLHFNELCSRAFFQLDNDEEYDHTMYGLLYECCMHDLIHDLSRSITEFECNIVKSGKENISKTVRHLRIDLNIYEPAVLKKFKKLQSVYLECATEECNIDEFISTCIAQLRYMRIFDLKMLSFEVLPRSIGTLKHLRYLNISDNKKIRRLPNSICMLQNLQTLLLHGCEELEELPRGLRKLVSLRTLSVTTKQEHFPDNEIGCLKSLRTFFILDCGNLLSLPPDMSNCTTLRTLLIGQCGQLDLATDLDVAINKLRLQRLLIDDLPQMTALPHWLKGASHCLKLLVIRNCNKLGALPEFLPKFVSLQKLVIGQCKELLGLPNGMEGLTSLTQIQQCKQLHLESGHGRSSVQLKLQTLIIQDLPQAIAIPNWLRGASDSLWSLEIHDCPKFVTLPEFLPNFVSLQKLVITKCEELLGLPNGMEGLTSLTHLEIQDCKQLHLESGPDRSSIQLKLQKVIIEKLPQAIAIPNWLQGASDSLRHLEITECQKLVELPEWLSKFASLKTLRIGWCQKLSALPERMQLLTSLVELTIIKCRQLDLASESNEVVQLCLQKLDIEGLPATTKLPEWLKGAAHTLQYLYIQDCPKLDALPEWLPDLTSLKKISIRRCPELSSLPDGMSRITTSTDFVIWGPSDALRANSAHISNIRFRDS